MNSYRFSYYKLVRKNQFAPLKNFKRSIHKTVAKSKSQRVMSRAKLQWNYLNTIRKKICLHHSMVAMMSHRYLEL